MDKKENINKKDIELILEVNTKAIEIQTAVADQNEHIIEALTEIKAKHEDTYKLEKDNSDKIIKLIEELNKDIFKIQVLFVSGLLAMIAQIVQMFLKK